MKKMAVVLAVCILIVNLVGCGPKSNTALINSTVHLKEMDIRKNEFDDKIAASINEIGIDVLKDVSQDSNEDNVIISPLSLSVVLALLSNGAEKDTKKEIEALINPHGLTTDQLNNQYSLILNIINSLGYEEDNKRAMLAHIANSMWISRNFPLEEKFVEDGNMYYDTEIYDVNFSSRKTISEINKWIRDKTNGRIDNYLESIEPETVMYIFNSLYFNGKWQNKFNKKNTKKESFYLKDDSKVKVDMMNAERQMLCYEDEEITAGRLSYYGCSMEIVIPKGNIDEYISNLNYSELEDKLKGFEYIKAKIKLPKFQYEAKYSLNETLKMMGVNKAFDNEEADFEGITKQDILYVDDVSQKCFISVDEEGTEAAALTSVAICGSGMPPEKNIELYADRPFIYFIKHNGTGAIMFAGVVYKP